MGRICRARSSRANIIFMGPTPVGGSMHFSVRFRAARSPTLLGKSAIALLLETISARKEWGVTVCLGACIAPRRQLSGSQDESLVVDLSTDRYA